MGALTTVFLLFCWMLLVSGSMVWIVQNRLTQCAGKGNLTLGLVSHVAVNVNNQDFIRQVNPVKMFSLKVKKRFFSWTSIELKVRSQDEEPLPS